MDIAQIKELIAQNKLAEAFGELTDIINEAPTAEAWYMRGRVNWKMNRKGEAKSDYNEAIALDPDSPAKLALEMADDVLNFFNPDLLNP